MPTGPADGLRLWIHRSANNAGCGDACEWACAATATARASRKAATAEVIARPASNMVTAEKSWRMSAAGILFRKERRRPSMTGAAEACGKPAILPGLYRTLCRTGAGELENCLAQRTKRQRLVHEDRDAGRLERLLRQPVDPSRHHHDGGPGQKCADLLG